MDLETIEQLAVPTRGGTDTVVVNDLAGTALQAVDIDLQASVGGGDGAADTVITNGTEGADTVDVSRSGEQVVVGGLAALTRITGNEATLDTLRVQTLGGDDDVTVAPDVSDLITPVVDLGAGE